MKAEHLPMPHIMFKITSVREYSKHMAEIKLQIIQIVRILTDFGSTDSFTQQV